LSSDQSLKFGNIRANPELFEWNLDDIRIYKRALKSDEIEALYFENGFPGRLPTIITRSISDISTTSAQSGGVFSLDENTEIIKKGICWNNFPNPDIGSFKTENGGGLDPFSATLTNLQPNTTYYVRAYSINNAGIGYGKEISFKTRGNDSIDLNKGLMAYYPFHGNANDESGNGHQGTTNGAVLTNDRFGNPDYAYKFDGQTNLIYVTDLHIPFYGATINCWAKGLNKIGLQDIMAKYFGYWDIELLIRMIDKYYQIEWSIGDKHVELSNKGDSVNPGLSGFDMLTLVYDGTQIYLYINNTIVDSKTISGTIFNNSLPLLFGGSDRGSSGSPRFNGIIDDIRIYNRPLNNAEITTLYNEENDYPK
jgi:hypothetical protein